MLFLYCFVGRREAGGSIGRHPSRNSGYLEVVTPVDSGVVVVLAALDRRARCLHFQRWRRQCVTGAHSGVRMGCWVGEWEEDTVT